ncbi:hypothetical protein KCG44_05900 [Pacificimonas sp. WHA3]|uniref:histidine kinase n=1 Tax=Pacificimonas pallii TaxID=2827236 RepID=A0ABS6SD33_9SPHN|nr:ATP-binding protein [Pacificimonas pallii]MBV7256317.1 hypothetical protein [Pacificimonas pallii]
MTDQGSKRHMTLGLSRLSAMDPDGPFGPRAFAEMYSLQSVNNIVIVLLSLVGALIITWGHIPGRLELVWFGVFALLLSVQIFRRIKVNSKQLTEARARRLLRNTTSKTLLAGIMWGITALAVPYLPGPGKVALPLIALSLAVASTTTLSAVPKAAIAFIIPVVLSYVTVFAAIGNTDYFVLVFLSFAFLGAILVGIGINAGALRASLQARSEAQKSKDELARSQALWTEFSRSAEAFALYDGNGTILLWNEAYRRLLGVKALRAGAKWVDIDTANREALPEDAILRQGGPVSETYSRTFPLDDRWFRSTIGPVATDHVAIYHVDISNLKTNEDRLLTLQKDLVAARDRAEAASAAKTDFLAKMSHELRTPLNAVIGFSDLMVQDYDRDRVDPRRHMGYARIISDSGQHLLSIVNDLLDLARIETGQISLQETEVDLSKMMRSARLLIEGRSSDTRIRFAEEGLDKVIVACADRRLLRQTVLNLIENAAKFSNEHPEVTLRLEHRADGGADISVIDNGVGIPEDMLEAVQEPFVQAESSETRQYGGVGLGLSLVREFAQLHGGSLTLTRPAEGGTIATVDLPASRILTAAG